MEDRKTTRRNLWMFPLGTVGRDMMYNLVTSYLLTFVLFTHTLTAAQLTAITAIIISSSPGNRGQSALSTMPKPVVEATQKVWKNP